MFSTGVHTSQPHELLTNEEVRRAVDPQQRATPSTPSIVLFGHRSCRMCRQLQQQLTRLHARNPDVDFSYVSFREATKAIFAEHEVSTVPTVAVMKRGAEAPRFVEGATLQDVESALGLDWGV